MAKVSVKLMSDMSAINLIIIRILGVRRSRGRRKLVQRLINAGRFAVTEIVRGASGELICVFRPSTNLIAMVEAFEVADYVQGYR